LDDHDQVLADRHARRSPEERAGQDTRHRQNVDLFAANAKRS
jgi:hypothetical protein